MNNSVYTIRNYQPADFESLVGLNAEAERREPRGRSVSPEAVADRLGRPGYSPVQDLFLVELAGKVIGYMDVTPELRVAARRVILDCWLRPEQCRQGLAASLLDHARRRALELGAEVARVNVAEENGVARSVASGLGFDCVRRFLELRLEMADVPVADIDRVAEGCRHLQPGEEGKLTCIQNRAFASNWEYNPNTTEEIAYRISHHYCCLEDVVVTCDREDVTGYCWTEIIVEPASGMSRGRISMIGVDPAYRGRGVGRRVLLAGLAYLKGKGMNAVELTVDSENEPARALYSSVGFRLWKSSLWYEKPLKVARTARY